MTLIVEEYLKKSTEKAGDASTGNQLACVENLTRALAANKDSQSVYRASPFVDSNGFSRLDRSVDTGVD